MNTQLLLQFLSLCFVTSVVGAQSASNDTSTTTSDEAQPNVGWVAGPKQRGTLILVYGCLSTIFASTWTVLHLNVPGPEDTPWLKALRKAKWMAITVLFPEFIFSKAVCELRLAVADLYAMHVAMSKAQLKWTDTHLSSRRTSMSHSIQNARSGAIEWSQKREWTLLHSYYANMGGLLYTTRALCNRQDIPPCTASSLASALEHRSGVELLKEFNLRKEDIEDKSKADWLLKAIAMSQISWLILNVWARHVAQFPITQLEIASVAFSLIAIATYAANWWKPKDITSSTALTTTVEPGLWYQKPPRIFISFIDRLLAPAASEYVPDYSRIRRISNDRVWMEGQPPLILFLTAVSSLMFGGFHCLAWNFEFPSKSELVLWRVASIASTTLPSVSLGISLVSHYLSTAFADRRHVVSVINSLAPLNHFPPAWWGLLERRPSLAILVLLFTSLRSTPKGVYDDTPWTRFLPNIS
ncbi:uncharacterized protein LY89DRAFT_637487 [Mollisia scopiformis]|uniref:Uncharacterized protein n=1 Tax=Mollisia scopiformis TaxID=149040 RepID=A0A194XNB8_MOLSC|nr:uncharacterized protein LY89DRAFT_637487 [Mollisia scopiformis]KUJ21636.1 hypothetical protein LY89DRAFT_637487 [Mollisia scopiformis]